MPKRPLVPDHVIPDEAAQRATSIQLNGRIFVLWTICGVACSCGPNGEPLGCGYEPGHGGEHSWATLPTFENADTDFDGLGDGRPGA